LPHGELGDAGFERRWIGDVGDPRERHPVAKLRRILEHGVVIGEAGVLIACALCGQRCSAGIGMILDRKMPINELNLTGVGCQRGLDMPVEDPACRTLVVAELYDSDGCFIRADAVADCGE
jgi:hypothetical protein